MLKALRRRLTFANVIALIALFVALGGTVYAGSKFSGKSIKKKSEPGNRLKNDTVTGKQVKESTLKTVPSATNANTIQGTALNGITARAYAYVSSGGVLDQARSKGIASVTQITPSSGHYCVNPAPSSGIDRNKEFPVVSADEFDGSGTFHVAEIDSFGALTDSCPNGWVVITYSTPGGGASTEIPIAFSLIAP